LLDFSVSSAQRALAQGALEAGQRAGPCSWRVGAGVGLLLLRRVGPASRAQREAAARGERADLRGVGAGSSLPSAAWAGSAEGRVGAECSPWGLVGTNCRGCSEQQCRNPHCSGRNIRGLSAGRGPGCSRVREFVYDTKGFTANRLQEKRYFVLPFEGFYF